MFKKGDTIHLKDGTRHRMKTDGLPPRAGTRSKAKALKTEGPTIRGFVRGALVNPDGSACIGPWHENTVTLKGHEQIVRNFAGLASSGGASWWGIGSHNGTHSSQMQTQTRMDSEWGTASNSAVNANGAVRANVGGSQALAGNWTLSQSWQYPSSQISDNQVLNCLAQYASSAISTTAASTDGRNCALSLATFASSSKSNSQALNITYNWSFGT